MATTESSEWSEPAPGIDPAELAELAREAYIFGYPLVLMDVTRAVFVASAPLGGSKGVSNQFQHARAFPDATFTGVVSPNADTLYSTAWLDLEREPVVLSVPDTAGRYYLMPMLDAWTNVFASPGARTTGTGRHDFAILGPEWAGDLPLGLERIHAPTPRVWLIGRTYTAGKADYPAVHAVQDQYRLAPLSQWMGRPAPPRQAAVDEVVDTTTPPVEQVARMDARTFFTRLADLIESNPPAPEDDPLLDRMASLGLFPGPSFEPGGLGARAHDLLEDAIRAARAQIATSALGAGETLNGWNVHLDLGQYGTDYLRRAGIALAGLGANLPEDAVYLSGERDGTGRPLDGRARYELRFGKGETPPVNAFWSITLYDERHFFAANPIDRYALGDRDPLRFDADGSLVIHVQNERPGGDRDANWLPAPAGPFSLIMRLYHPKPEVLEGRWKPPAVRLGKQG